ncbi:hypothetical protein [Desulfoluna spongiiphila]|uniref:Outer membrane protein beta-barrel domain-containing protein n=1 Tax=Desulfoluna spongiiphila TaxID=419481 RepID=A0A1G5HQU5_9BACT|nr:hypothetical protein [Desulfoluna spongiiphila]SCY66133.1 hypothetical protein SAMN05216233_11574 [Desulfoluna spongiiphila]VVS95729.1 consensus disorder prediction [Desulfoluna spongiiphila]
MNRSRFYSLVLMLGISLCTTALPTAASASDDPNTAYVEIAGNHNPNAGGGGGGLSLYGDHTAFMAGVSVFSSSELDDFFIGFSLGARFHRKNPFRSSVTPFIGLGGFLGFTEEEEEAEDDDTDNDMDGEVDEEGETESSIADTLATIYPEVGLHINIPGDGILTLSARYNITSKGRDFDSWIYALGFTIPFYF